jgi:hypothetical protein
MGAGLTAKKMADCRWLKPVLVGQFEFLEWTGLIGTVRRECLDRTLFWTAADLEGKLADFQRYFNGHRTHAGLGRADA